MTDRNDTAEEHLEVKAEEARAGRKGKPVLYVLIGGIVLIAIGLAIAFGVAI